MHYTNEHLLSIIVPNYNSTHHLPRLLDSIQRQSLRDLEIIIVDDGSATSCRDIVDAYQNKGMPIRLVEHGKRCGTHNARLTGIKSAKGKIIAFADADDAFYGTTTLEYHAQLLLKEHADIVHFNTLREASGTREQLIISWDIPWAPFLNGAEIFRVYASNIRAWVVWNKLYSRELCLRDIDFIYNPDKILWTAEDLYLTNLFFFNAKRYCGSERVGYFNIRNYEDKKYQSAAGNLITEHSMLSELLPFFQKHNCADDLLKKMKKFLVTLLFRDFSFLCEKCYDSPQAPLNAGMFRQLTSGENSVELSNAMRYACSMANEEATRQGNIASRLKECLAELEK